MKIYKKYSFQKTLGTIFARSQNAVLEKELINKSDEFIKYIRSLCDRDTDFDQEEATLDTMYLS